MLRRRRSSGGRWRAGVLESLDWLTRHAACRRRRGTPWNAQIGTSPSAQPAVWKAWTAFTGEGRAAAHLRIAVRTLHAPYPPQLSLVRYTLPAIPRRNGVDRVGDEVVHFALLKHTDP